MKHHVCIGLGSNLGNKAALLQGAIDALRTLPGNFNVVCSRFVSTIPIGGPQGQGTFLNAAATLETNLSPVQLLEAMQKIETQAGRVRTLRWGERTLDLDMLLYDQEVIEIDILSVPHPRLAVRRFVLEPLAEIAPHAIEPRTRRTINSLLENINRTPRLVALSGWNPSLLRAIQNELPTGWHAVESNALPHSFKNQVNLEHAAPLFIAAPQTMNRERPATEASWPAQTPLIFFPDHAPAQEIRAACLAALPTFPRGPTNLPEV